MGKMVCVRYGLHLDHPQQFCWGDCAKEDELILRTLFHEYPEPYKMGVKLIYGDDIRKWFKAAWQEGFINLKQSEDETHVVYVKCYFDEELYTHLNSGICHKCYEKDLKEGIQLHWYYEKERWVSFIEMWNQEGSVVCTCAGGKPKKLSVFDKPPEECPHKFEHATAAGLSVQSETA